MPEPTQKQSVLGHIKDNWKKYALGAAAGTVLGTAGTLGTLKYGVQSLKNDGYDVRVVRNQNHPRFRKSIVEPQVPEPTQ